MLTQQNWTESEMKFPGPVAALTPPTSEQLVLESKNGRYFIHTVLGKKKAGEGMDDMDSK